MLQLVNNLLLTTITNITTTTTNSTPLLPQQILQLLQLPQQLLLQQLLPLLQPLYLPQQLLWLPQLLQLSQQLLFLQQQPTTTTNSITTTTMSTTITTTTTTNTKRTTLHLPTSGRTPPRSVANTGYALMATMTTQQQWHWQLLCLSLIHIWRCYWLRGVVVIDDAGCHLRHFHQPFLFSNPRFNRRLWLS